MESTERRYLRWWERKYVIHPGMQFRYAMTVVLIALFSSFVSSALILWSFSAFNIWQGQWLPTPVLMTFAFVIVLNALAVLITMLLLMHKIVGPIFNLTKQFERLGSGDFAIDVRFREGDEFHHVGEQFNLLVSKLSARNKLIFDSARAAKALLDDQKVNEASRKLDEILQLGVKRES